MADSLRLERGVVTLSLDLELIWGTLDLFGPTPGGAATRRTVIDRILPLRGVRDPATWCVVGHLFLDRCYAENGGSIRDRPSAARVAAVTGSADESEAQAPIFPGRVS
jgi:hypothetical protein